MSTSVSRSASEGQGSFDVFSSPPEAEVVSGAVAAVVFGTMSEATGAGVGVVGVAKSAKGCASRSAGEGGRGTVPGMPSVEKHMICF